MRHVYAVLAIMFAFAQHDSWHAKEYGWMVLELVAASIFAALYETALLRHHGVTHTPEAGDGRA